MLTLKNPEMRQLQELKTNYDNCRPSGLFGNKVENNSLTGKKKIFTIKTISDITPNGAIKRWIVISSGKRSVLIRYLFLKFVYDELTKEEYRILLSFNEVTNSVPMFFALKARIHKIPKRNIRKVLETIQFPLFKIPTRDEYISLKKISFTFEVKTYPPIKKPKPYSGYSKGYKDGKRRSKFQIDEYNSTPLEPSPNFEDEINILLEFILKASSHPRKLSQLLLIFKENKV